jgi:uncharacterized protein
MGETNQDSTRVVKWTYVTFVILIGVWIVAWVLKLRLDRVSGGGTSAGGFMYWTSAKLLIWILPALWLIRLSGRSLKQVFNLSNYKGWFLWGGGIGLGIALTAFIPNYLNGSPILPTQFNYAILNVLVISPIFEEFLMRGALLGNLQQQHSFWGSNLISSLMFVVLHLPGWFFMGSIVENITKPAGGAASIFLISLMCGYAVKRSNSVIGGMFAHFLNNLA